MEIYIFFSIMVIVKSLYILPFIYNWRLNYPHLFLDTNQEQLETELSTIQEAKIE